MTPLTLLFVGTRSIPFLIKSIKGMTMPSSHKSLARFVIFVLFVASFVCSTRVVAGDSRALVFEVTNDTLSLNGTKIIPPSDSRQLLRILGKPQRVLTSYHSSDFSVLIWDELGLWANVATNINRVFDFDIFFISSDRDRVSPPKKTFSGILRIEGASITSQSSITAINQAMRSQKKFKVAIDEFGMEELEDTWLLGIVTLNTKSPQHLVSNVSFQWRP